LQLLQFDIEEFRKTLF